MRAATGRLKSGGLRVPAAAERLCDFEHAACSEASQGHLVLSGSEFNQQDQHFRASDRPQGIDQAVELHEGNAVAAAVLFADFAKNDPAVHGLPQLRENLALQAEALDGGGIMHSTPQRFRLSAPFH
jgi:hypothetical protein